VESQGSCGMKVSQVQKRGEVWGGLSWKRDERNELWPLKEVEEGRKLRSLAI